MKPHFNFASFLAAIGCNILSAAATTYQWDVNDATSGLGGAGTWNTSNSYWDLFGSGNDDGTDATAAITFTSADTAKFGGTAGLVTLGSPTTINGLIFDTDGYSLTGSTLTLAGTTPTISVNTGTAIVSSSLAGTALTKAGSGTLTVSGSSTFSSGTITVNAGTLSLSQSGFAFNEASGWGNGRAILVNSGATVRLASDFNAGYSRAVTIDGGTLNATAGIATDSSNYLNNLTLKNGATVSGNALRMGYHSDATVTVAGTSASTYSAGISLIKGGSYAAVFDVADVTTSSATDLTVPGAIADGAGYAGTPVIKTGAGTLTLSGTNTYDGNTTIRAGTIVAEQSSALGDTGTVYLNDAGTGTNNTTLLIKGENTISRNIVIANQGTGTVTIGGTAIKVSSQYASAAFSGTVALNRDVTLYNGDGASDRLIFSNVISGSGNITVDGVVSTEPNYNTRVSFTQSSNNTFQGNVNVTATGRLQLGAGGGAADLIYDGAIVTVASGGQLVLAKGGQNETIGALSGAGSVFSAWGNDTLTVGGNNQSGTFSGIIKQVANTLKLTKIGSGTQTLTGANTFNAGIAIQNGTLAIGGASGTVASQGLTLGNSTDSGVLVIGDSSNAKSLTFSSLNTSGTGTANAIVAGGNALASTLTINTATTDTYAGTFGGAGTNQSLIVLNKLGAGSLTLSGGGSVSEVRPDAGTLNISGGVLNVNNAFSYSDWGTARTSTVNQTGGTVTLGGGANYYGGRSSNQSITYNLSAGTFDASAGSFWLAWDGGSNPTFNVSGTGLLKVAGLNQANTGASGGTLNLTGGRITIGSGGIGFNKYIFNTLNFGGGTIASSAAFSGNAGQAITLTGTNGATTFDSTGGNITLNGGLSGAGSLTKSGSGTLTLTGTRTYNGDTTITGGTLALTGSGALASTGVIVGTGATFDVSGVTGGYTSGSGQTISGTGTIMGNLTVGGTLAPGSSPGTLSVSGNLNFNSGSIFAWELDAQTSDPGADTPNGGSYDKVTVSGNLGGTGSKFDITLLGNTYDDPFWDSNKSWTGIFNLGGGNMASTFSEITGTSIVWDTITQRGVVGTTGYFSIGGSTLSWTAVPELSNLLAGGLLGAGLLRRRRRA